MKCYEIKYYNRQTNAVQFIEIRNADSLNELYAVISKEHDLTNKYREVVSCLESDIESLDYITR